MQIRKTWVVGATLALGVAIATSVAASTGHAEPKKECELASEWVDANRDRLPSTLSEISKHPVAYRRAIHAALPREVQVELWREHLGSFVMAESRLSGPQRELVQNMLANLDRYFGVSGATPMEQELRSRIYAVFSHVEATPVFAMLGPMPAAPVIGRSTPPSLAAPACVCSRTSNYCWNSYCVSGACEPVEGCGTFWLYTCDGECGGGGPDHDA